MVFFFSSSHLCSTAAGGGTDRPVHVLPAEFGRSGNVRVSNRILVTYSGISGSEQEL